MITILKTSKELTKKEKYLLTQNPAIQTIQKVEDNTLITPVVWCVYEEEKDDGKDEGKTVTILSMIDNETKNVYACQSVTFRKSFLDIADIFEEGEVFSIIKISGETKAGREYINCILDTANM